jgi:hypothetical protein
MNSVSNLAGALRIMVRGTRCHVLPRANFMNPNSHSSAGALAGFDRSIRDLAYFAGSVLNSIAKRLTGR